VLGDLRRPANSQLLAAMQPRMLAQAELVGTYEKQRR
jgi:hypothetical protein